MKLSITALFLLVFSFSNAQKSNKEVPKSFTKSVSLISVYLTKDIRSEEKKVEAIYDWITGNIEFDYDILQKKQVPVVQNPKQVLKSRKATSHGYVELMRSMLEVIDIESEPVMGYIHDMHWFPGKPVIKESHVWIAVKINGKWKLADPTWDAGFIGRIPKKVKPYKPKKYLFNKWKDVKKEERKLAEREDKEVERIKKHEEKKGYTNKTGFVSKPVKDFFFIHADTFLLSHAPTLPRWQLRETAISLASFSKAEDSLILDIEAPKGVLINAEAEIADYKELDYFQQLILHGEKGYEYNPDNPWLKVHYYYEFMVLVHNKELQKLARGSAYEITPNKYRALAAHADTIVKYCKLHKTAEKEWFKQNKTYDKEQYKESAARDKVNTKLTKKVTDGFEKLSGTLETNTKTLEKNIEKLDKSMAKIMKDYEKSIVYEMPDDLDTSVLMPWLSQLRERKTSIDKRSQNLVELRQNSSYNSLFSNVNYLSKLLGYNEHYIRFNSYSTTEWIKEVDSLIQRESALSLSLMKDSITQEMLEKELMEELRVMEEICKTAKVELNQLKTEGKIRFPYKYELYLQSIYAQTIRSAKKTHLQSVSFNEQVEKALRSKRATINQIDGKMSKQDGLKEKKYEYILDMTEKEHERIENYREEIEKKAKAWEKKYSEK